MSHWICIKIRTWRKLKIYKCLKKIFPKPFGKRVCASGNKPLTLHWSLNLKQTTSSPHVQLFVLCVRTRYQCKSHVRQKQQKETRERIQTGGGWEKSPKKKQRNRQEGWLDPRVTGVNKFPLDSFCCTGIYCGHCRIGHKYEYCL